MSTNKFTKLKFQLTDTTFIPNKYGTENVDRNTYYNNKNGFKLSTITDKNGVHFGFSVHYGSSSDIDIFEQTFNEIFIDTKTSKIKNNKYKQYMLARLFMQIHYLFIGRSLL